MRKGLITGILQLGFLLHAILYAQAQIVALDARHGFDSAYNLATGQDFSRFRDQLEFRNLTILPETSFDSDSLAHVDLLVLLQPFIAALGFSDSEIMAIENFVNAGKGLLVLGDAGGNSAASLLNPLSSHFGVTYSDEPQDETGHVVSQFNAHPLTAGLGSVGIDLQRRLTISPGALDLTPAAGADDFLAVSGRAVFLSDSCLFSNPDSGAPHHFRRQRQAAR